MSSLSSMKKTDASRRFSKIACRCMQMALWTSGCVQIAWRQYCRNDKISWLTLPSWPSLPVYHHAPSYNDDIMYRCLNVSRLFLVFLDCSWAYCDIVTSNIDPETLLWQGFPVFLANFTIALWHTLTTWISAKVGFHQLSRIHGFHETFGGADGKMNHKSYW